MPTMLVTGMIGTEPYSMVRAGNNKLLMANGFDRMQRWNGTSVLGVTAGVDPPVSAPTIASGAAGTITGSNYSAYIRYVDSEGNPGNLSPLSNTLTSLAAKQINWTGIPVPDDPKITKKQLLRNTSGQATVFYVVAELTNMATTTYTDNVADSVLQNQEAVPIVDGDNQNVGNRFTVPPTNKACLALHLGRVFGAVEKTVFLGHVVMINGSTAVTGIGTNWSASLAGRQIYIPGQPVATVATIVGPRALTLSSAWTGTSLNFAPYAIKSAPALLRTVAWSEADYLEAWPAFNAVTVPDTGGEITGLASMSSFLYVIEDKIINRFSFQNDPSNGALYIATYRGCINNRCWVVIDDSMMYMLDRNGIHAFDGGQKSEPISEPIQEIFRESASGIKVQWRDTRFWHARHYSEQGTIRWFVTMAGGPYPRHAICYQYRLKRWWIEEYPIPMLSGTEALKGAPQVYLGSKNNIVWGVSRAAIDGVVSQLGTSGQVFSANRFTIVAANYTFPSLVEGCPIQIIEGRGIGQRAIIASASGTTATLRTPMTVIPDQTSRFVVGGINWYWRSGRYRWTEDESEQYRAVDITYQPTTAEETVEVSVYEDFSKTPVQYVDVVGSIDEGPVDSLKVDMRNESGSGYLRMDESRGMRTDGPRYVQVELSGVRAADTIRIYNLDLYGASQ
jgi:hypothetical protein